MLDRLLNKTDWQYAGLMIRDSNPMLVQRTHTKIAKEEDTLVVRVANAPHPFTEGRRASAEHNIPVSSITSITYYKDISEPIIHKPNGEQSIIAP